WCGPFLPVPRPGLVARPRPCLVARPRPCLAAASPLPVLARASLPSRVGRVPPGPLCPDLDRPVPVSRWCCRCRVSPVRRCCPPVPLPGELRTAQAGAGPAVVPPGDRLRRVGEGRHLGALARHRGGNVSRRVRPAQDEPRQPEPFVVARTQRMP